MMSLALLSRGSPANNPSGGSAGGHGQNCVGTQDRTQYITHQHIVISGIGKHDTGKIQYCVGSSNNIIGIETPLIDQWWCATCHNTEAGGLTNKDCLTCWLGYDLRRNRADAFPCAAGICKWLGFLVGSTPGYKCSLHQLLQSFGSWQTGLCFQSIIDCLPGVLKGKFALPTLVPFKYKVESTSLAGDRHMIPLMGGHDRTL